MLFQIIRNTPVWVAGLFLALLLLGLSQAVARSASLRRITVMPIAMIGLSIWGTVSTFGAEPLVLSAWLASALLAGALVLRMPLPAGTRYEAGTRHFHVPGSFAPLALIMGIFLSKYCVGVMTAMHPELRHDPMFSLFFGSLNGLFSGVFAARSLRLWRLTLRHARSALAVA
ncbi:MAG: hypothetical protein Q8K31_04760 [Burkholderiaceae bacterium]|nr:hypothetical protein [Burkholderiaceae bacterium]MDO9090311.1 hypothetical protein [Burkholderiaceae bacterium]MDP1968479.1 hypothetical protein [Burkholderiaceae bacterium]